MSSHIRRLSQQEGCMGSSGMQFPIGKAGIAGDKRRLSRVLFERPCKQLTNAIFPDAADRSIEYLQHPALLFAADHADTADRHIRVGQHLADDMHVGIPKPADAFSPE